MDSVSSSVPPLQSSASQPQAISNSTAPVHVPPNPASKDAMTNSLSNGHATSNGVNPDRSSLEQTAPTPSSTQVTTIRASLSEDQQSQPHSRSLDNPPSESTGPSASAAASPQRSGSTTRSSETERSRRRRSAMDFRSGPRISDLFSNLLHRRQDAASSTDNIPRHPSPALNEHIITPFVNVPKTEPPPPALPPPTLAELGLSMSVLTANLAPAHFSTPPISGTFLAPHYLLLCHSQGLDVLPLVTPPSPEPYALVRRVNFKSVVVMEERGVLIAIAGKRDGVRVYALDELRRVIEWRLDLETRKERERIRKEDAKKPSGNVDHVFALAATGEFQKDRNKQALRLSSLPPMNMNNSLPPQPRSPTVPFHKSQRVVPPTPKTPAVPADSPPAYTPTSQGRRGSSSLPLSMSPPGDIRSRSASVSTTMAASSQRALLQESRTRQAEETDEKGDWIETAGSSDDEALSLAAAGASGSAALDERTSAMPSDSGMNVTINNSPRPPNFRELRAQSVAVITPIGDLGHSPTQASSDNLHRTVLREGTGDGDGGNDEEDEPTTPTGEISLAQALLESRIPDLPPPGTRTQQQAIILPTHSNAIAEENPPAGRRQIFNGSPPPSVPSSPSMNRAARRRWSILGPSPSSDPPRERREENRPAELLLTAPASRGPPPSPTTRSVLRRSNSHRAVLDSRTPSRTPLTHAHSASTPEPIPPQSAPAHLSRRFNGSTPSLPSTSSNRFLPRILSAALGSRKSEENIKRDPRRVSDNKTFASPIGAPPPPQPKLDYVKLPGTKGSVLIKAVETARKSFLASLCGEGGEKVELFAGTYRTALSLSRTFILPDSPRSLELQVQGDDLVEIFLVFSQNVFGLEPATVRVREVRIGRGERRAARRRAREGRELAGDETPALTEEDTNISVNIGLVGGVEQDGLHSDVLDDPSGRDGMDDPDSEPQTSMPTITSSDPHEFAALATVQSAPYTTFQQLSFSPAFPLATLGDDVIIPPSYPAFLRHRDQHESTSNEIVTEQPIQQFTPPGLPPPRMILQCRWYYRDPKGVIQGPWKTSLMQSWYKDGLLPMDLPVRRDIDGEYIALKDLRAQSTDPDQPFKQHLPSSPEPVSQAPTAPDAKPLLPPVSILEQPRHFGPPALFFSSRGGHSTTIVDAKGRPVLKGRLMWSRDEESEMEQPALLGKLGDVKRVEAFDVQNRAVIVALRQGGLEAVDVGDALYRPADESRAYIPLYQAPKMGFNRRGSYIWRIGGPLALPQTASPVASCNPRGPIPKKGSLKPLGRAESYQGADDTEIGGQEEVLFLGRQDDDLYLCERNLLSFRILRLSPS